MTSPFVAKRDIPCVRTLVRNLSFRHMPPFLCQRIRVLSCHSLSTAHTSTNVLHKDFTGRSESHKGKQDSMWSHWNKVREVIVCKQMRHNMLKNLHPLGSASLWHFRKKREMNDRASFIKRLSDVCYLIVQQSGKGVFYCLSYHSFCVSLSILPSYCFPTFSWQKESLINIPSLPSPDFQVCEC